MSLPSWRESFCISCAHYTFKLSLVVHLQGVSIDCHKLISLLGGKYQWLFSSVFLDITV